MTLGQKIEMHRKGLGLTQAELGEKLGVKKNAVSKWECGRVENISASKIRSMAKLFGVSFSYLIDEESNLIPADFEEMPSTSKKPRLGSISCGEPIFAEQNVEGYDEVPDYVKCDFTLVCKGDSMIGARIYDGDVVCIRRQNDVVNGQIAAVQVDGEFESKATLKRVRYIKNGIMLLPENPEYEPFVYVGEDAERVHIIGLATHFISIVK